MPQDLPSWAKPYSPPPRQSPWDTPSRESPESSPYGSPYDDSPYADPGGRPFDNGGIVPFVINPPPGTDCGECDVSGLTLELENEDGTTTTVDCDSDPATCELICCNFPAPDQCAAAYSQPPCAIPLTGLEFLLIAGLMFAWIKLRSAPSGDATQSPEGSSNASSEDPSEPQDAPDA